MQLQYACYNCTEFKLQFSILQRKYALKEDNVDLCQGSPRSDFIFQMYIANEKKAATVPHPYEKNTAKKPIKLNYMSFEPRK